MSEASKYLFDPFLHFLQGLTQSSHAPTAAAAKAALADANKLGADASTALGGVLAGTITPTAAGSTVLTDFQNGINDALDSYISVAIPVIGPGVAAIAQANLPLLEDHAVDYIRQLIRGKTAAIVATANAIVPQVQSQQSSSLNVGGSGNSDSSGVDPSKS